jgi:hypothetical protein
MGKIYFKTKLVLIVFKWSNCLHIQIEKLSI